MTKPIHIRKRKSPLELHLILKEKYLQAKKNHKPTKSIHREHVLEIAKQLRREMRMERKTESGKQKLAA
jgi:hypothetical protein